jgi:hypothetical protein
MICSDCGAEVPTKSFYCEGCGRPVGFEPQVAIAAEDPGLDDVPAPGASQEAESMRSPAMPEAFQSSRPGKALCSMCMGAFPETVMTIVDNRPFCPDCSPLTGRRKEPEVQPTVAEDVPPPPWPAPTTTTAPTAPAGLTEQPEIPAYPRFTPQDRPAGSGSKGVFAVLLLVLIGAAGFAAYQMMGGGRIDALMAGVDTGRPEANALVYKYEPAQELYYNAIAKFDITVDIDGAGAPFDQLEANAKLYGGLSMLTLGTDKSGNADLRLTFKNFDLDLEILADGEPFPMPFGDMDMLGQLNGETMEMKVNAYGEPVGRPTGMRPGGMLDGSGMKEMFDGMLEGVPRKELKVGDTWTAKESVPLGPGADALGMSGMNVSATYKVEGYKRIAGRDCMVISMKGELDSGQGNISLPGMGGSSMNMDMNMSMQGVVFFDIEAGCLVKTAVDVDADLSMAAPGGAMDMTLDMQMDIDLQ